MRIPFRDLIWLRFAPEADQSSGLPPSHAAIKADSELSDYAETALVQQRVQSCLAAVLVADTPMIYDRHIELGPRVTDAEGNTVEEVQPGSFAIAHNVKDVRSIAPEIAPFPVAEHTARVAAGQGLMAETISGRVGQASYSALRMARVAEQEVTDEFAEATDWCEALETVVEWYRMAEMVRGRSWDHAEHEWLQRGRSSLDELRDAEAERVRIETGTMSKAEGIRRSGRNPRKVFAEIAEEAGQLPSSDSDNDSDSNSNKRWLLAA